MQKGEFMSGNPIAILIHMIGTIAVIIILTFFVNNRYYDYFQTKENSQKQRACLLMGLVGGLFGIYANYSGVAFEGAIISIRDIGPMMAGLAGGPVGGLIAGLIAGLHRLTLGGPTVYACSLATFTIGGFCGLLHLKFKEKIIKSVWAVAVAVVMEAYHLLLVLIIVKPMDTAVSIIKTVALPLIIANAVGLVLMIAVTNYIGRQRQIMAERERISSELDVATRIQTSMLPVILPTFPGRKELDLQASMTPAKEVGGDFYDIFYTDEDHLALVMADVSGKGIPAALFMVVSKTLIKNNLQDGMTPAVAMTRANQQLCEHNEAGMFVTAWVCVIEISTGRVTYVNAGHNPPLVRRGGRYEFLKGKSGFILAGMDMTKYKEFEMFLDDGDALFLYTDGVTEAENLSHELLGEDRLIELLRSGNENDPNKVLEDVQHAIEEHAGEAEQFDDITMMSAVMNGGYRTKKLCVDSSAVEEASRFAEEVLSGCELPHKTTAALNICIDEIVSNIIKYSGCTDAEIAVSFNGARISMRFTDDGKEYDPTASPEPDLESPAEEREIGGLGVFMVKKMMDHVEYERRGDTNVLVIRKLMQEGDCSRQKKN